MTSSISSTPPFGIVAGQGRFPLLVAESVRSSGQSVVAVALKEEAPPEIERLADRCEWISLGKLEKVIRFLKDQGVRQAVFAGRVRHTRLFSDIVPDWRAGKLLLKLSDKRTDSILRAVADEFAQEGIEMVSSVSCLQSLMAETGLMCGRSLLDKQKADIELGREVCRALGGLDVGQTVCVKDRAVVAVEAMEGTNEVVERAGRLSRGGFVVVKMAKPNQDFRFDVPVVGVDSVRVLAEAGASVLAMEAGKTLILDKPDFLVRARDAKISVIGI